MRVLITPHDIAGQMGILARSLRSIGVDAWSVEVERRDSHLQFETDEHLGIDPHGPAFVRAARRGAFAVRALREFDVLHYFFGRSILPRGLDGVVGRSLGRSMVMHFRGSDVTTIERRIALSGALGGAGNRSNPAQRGMVQQWRRRGATLLISTPDLWREVPDALLVPQAIELDAGWAFDPMMRERGPLTIGHAPTNRAVKGSEIVLRAIEELRHRKRDVRLRLIEGVAPTDVPALLRGCDIVVDQIIQGAYGNVTIQAMALGRPTVNYLDPVYEERGIAVPTMHTTPERLVDDLERLLNEEDLRADLATRGRAFTEERHDGRMVAAILAELYQSIGAA